MDEVTREARGVLVKARGVIANPLHWTKGSLYGPAPDGGRAFCAVGAVQWVNQNISFELGMLIEQLLLDAMPNRLLHANHIPTFNDDPKTTHADVLAMFDRAIARCDEMLGVKATVVEMPVPVPEPQPIAAIAEKPTVTIEITKDGLTIPNLWVGMLPVTTPVVPQFTPVPDKELVPA